MNRAEATIMAYKNGGIPSLEFLEAMLELASEKAKEDSTSPALSALYSKVNEDGKCPVIIDRIVEDIDGIALDMQKYKTTKRSRPDVRRLVTELVWVKYRIKNNEIKCAAFEYLENYFYKEN